MSRDTTRYEEYLIYLNVHISMKYYWLHNNYFGSIVVMEVTAAMVPSALSWPGDMI